MRKTQKPFNPESKETQHLLRSFNNKWKMWFYFLFKLPTAVFYGIRIKSLTPYKASVSVPFRWRTQNPFRSIYAGAQFAAAELAGGLIASLAIRGRGRISMLILKTEIQYLKKATSKTIFTCEEGQKILDCVQKAIDTGEGQKVTVLSEGIQKSGEVVFRMKFTWSFKVKN